MEKLTPKEEHTLVGAILLSALIVIGLLYGTYRLGHTHGFKDGYRSATAISGKSWERGVRYGMEAQRQLDNPIEEVTVERD